MLIHKQALNYYLEFFGGFEQIASALLAVRADELNKETTPHSSGANFTENAYLSRIQQFPTIEKEFVSILDDTTSHIVADEESVIKPLLKIMKEGRGQFNESNFQTFVQHANNYVGDMIELKKKIVSLGNYISPNNRTEEQRLGILHSEGTNSQNVSLNGTVNQLKAIIKTINELVSHSKKMSDDLLLCGDLLATQLDYYKKRLEEMKSSETRINIFRANILTWIT